MGQTVGQHGAAARRHAEWRHHLPGAVEERHRLGAVGERLLVAPDAQAHGHELELVGTLVEERDPLLDRDREMLGWSQLAQLVDGVALDDDDPRHRARRVRRPVRRRGEPRDVDAGHGTVPAPAQLAGLPRVVASREALVAPAASGDHHHQPTARGTELRLRQHLCPSAPPSGAGYRDAGGFGTLPRMSRTATCIWRVDAALVLALDERLGPPVDSYLNGCADLDHRRRPGRDRPRVAAPSGGRVPPAARPVALRPLGAGGRARCRPGVDPDALTLGSEPRTLRSLWDGLECYAAYGDDLEPAPLAQAATDALDRAPDAAGLVDHEAIGTAWEHAKGTTSIVEMVFAELKGGPR